MELHEPDGKNWDLCWPTAKVCEHKRSLVVKDKMGTTSPCVTQTVAYCVAIVHPRTITWKAYCSRTAEQCETKRKLLLDAPPAEGDEIGVCRLLRNVDPSEAMEARTSMR